MRRRHLDKLAFELKLELRRPAFREVEVGLQLLVRQPDVEVVEIPLRQFAELVVEHVGDRRRSGMAGRGCVGVAHDSFRVPDDTAINHRK